MKIKNPLCKGKGNMASRSPGSRSTPKLYNSACRSAWDTFFWDQSFRVCLKIKIKCIE